MDISLKKQLIYGWLQTIWTIYQCIYIQAQIRLIFAYTAKYKHDQWLPIDEPNECLLIDPSMNEANAYL